MGKTELAVVKELRNQSEQGRLADDVAIVYRLSGGSGEDGIDESVVLTASGSLGVRVRDGLATRPQGEAREEIGRETALDLCQLVLQGVENMIPESEARFIPDTLVGSISFAIGNEKQTFYFHADEEDCEHQGQPIRPEILKIRDRFRQIETECLAEADSAGPHGEKESE